MSTPRTAVLPSPPATVDDALSGLVLLVAVAGGMVLMDVVGSPWDLARGVLFTAMWAFAPRSWPWLLAAPLLALAFATGIAHGGDPAAWQATLPTLAESLPRALFMAAGPLLLHQHEVRPSDPLTFRRIGLLLSAAGMSSLALAIYEYALHAPAGADRAWPDTVVQVMGEGVMHAIGILLFAPVVVWVMGGGNRAGSGPILRAVATWLLPALAAYVLLAATYPGHELGDLLRRALAVVVVMFSVRHGWRGGTVAVALVAAALALELRLVDAESAAFTTRLYLSITCIVALLFGATTDDLRRHAAQLTALHQEAERLAEELRVAARRNLQAEERERRRLAGDLHDEFGQTLTAMQTHLTLAAPDLASAGRGETAQVLLRLAGAMRQQIRGILETLRPAALDELGLYAAIDRGTVRRMAEDSGLVFDTHLEGDARLLQELELSRRIAAYRMVQEAVTNVVRHAHATRCEVRIRATQRRRTLLLFLEVRDDGIGGVSDFHRGHGLRAMRDRIIALGGRLHVRNRHPGLRVHAVIPQGDVAARTEGDGDEDGVP